jgi:tetratricopeptide (TPR) repeat protein
MRNRKLWVFLFFSLFFSSYVLRGQDLFNSQNTAKYAEFLFLSGNYHEAIEEYERLIFTNQADDDSRLRLVKSYRLAGMPERASNRMKALWQNPETVSQNVAKELFALKVINSTLGQTEQSLADNRLLSQEEKAFFSVSSALLKDDFLLADTLLDKFLPHANNALLAFRSITDEALSQSFKSPLLAGMMSAALPGSGKIYTGNWEDGLLATAIIGVSAWQAYRGFERHGTSSAYGWIYSAIGGAFYIGNIYGSVKETNRYNQIKKTRIRVRVEAIFYNNL